MRANKFLVRMARPYERGQWVAERRAGNGELTWTANEPYADKSGATDAIRQLLWTIATQDLGLSPIGFIRLYAADCTYWLQDDPAAESVEWPLFELHMGDQDDGGAQAFMRRYDLVDPNADEEPVSERFDGTGTGDVLVMGDEQ